MKVAVCCIGRKENLYIQEFVEHYKDLGVDKIFIYDNNYDGEEHFEDVIQSSIDEGLVSVVDFRNINPAQIEAYNDCYMRQSKEYDWIVFVDCDEFLELVTHKSIKEFLSQEKFNGFELIHLNQIFYGDNGLIKYDNRKVSERFPQPVMPMDFKRTYDFPENNHVKSIIKGGIENVIWANPHTPNNQLKCCDVHGIEKNSCVPFTQVFDISEAYFKHYFTKSLQEWFEIKTKRGYPDGNKDWFLMHNIFEEYFKINERTKEKEEYIRELQKNIPSKNKEKLDIFICTHTDFQTDVWNEVYKVVNSKDINNDTWNGLKGSFYSEVMSYFYIADNFQLKDYVGTRQYRRTWGFGDNIPDMDEIFSKYDIVIPRPINFSVSIREQYKVCHNLEDLSIMSKIIARKYPTYVKTWERFLNFNMMIPWNMFIMKKDDFLNYTKFLRVCLDEYVKIVGHDIEGRIEENKERYLKNFYPNNEVWYQYRIGGYLAERLTNLWIMVNCKKKAIVDAHEINNKYQ